MTIPSERTRAVVETRRFLKKLAAGRMQESPEQLQHYATALLRHYPSHSDLYLTAIALPGWWSPPEEPRP